MPLSLCGIGKRAIIKKINGLPEIKKHLNELGFIEGAEVTLINSIGSGVIVKIQESEIAIDKTMANKILVG